jgi:hypothetical protein
MSQKTSQIFDSEPDANCKYIYSFCWKIPATYIPTQEEYLKADPKYHLKIIPLPSSD